MLQRKKMPVLVAISAVVCILLQAVATAAVKNLVYQANFDWGATGCKDIGCPAGASIGAITMDAMTVWDPVSREQLSQELEAPCPSNETFSTSKIPEETLRQMTCVYAAGQGTNENLWNNEVWRTVGVCSGLNVSEYFSLFASLYRQYDINKILYDINFKPETINGTKLKTAIQSTYGVNPIISCDTFENQPGYSFTGATICVNSTTKKPTTCISPQKPECLKTLYMTSEVVEPNISCAKYIPYTYKGALVSSPSPMPSSSPPPPSGNPQGDNSSENSDSASNTGAIIGGVVGGIAAVALIAGIVVSMRRRKQNATQNTYTDSIGKLSPTTVIDSAESYNGAGVNGSSSPDLEIATSPPVGPDYITTRDVNLALPSYLAVTPTGSSRHGTRPSYSIASDPLLSYVTSCLDTPGSRYSSNSDLSSWEVRFQDIQLETAIGEGSWGRVYKGVWHETTVAVKVLLDGPIHGVTDSETAAAALSNAAPSLALLKEAGLMSSLHHPNIVQLMGVCSFPAAIVTEYCSRGSLYEVLRKGAADPQEGMQLTWSLRINMLEDAAKGLLYLHQRSPPIIHRDLKSPNLLVTQSWTVKVADFNLSKLFEDATKSSSIAATNPRWLAPEVLSGAKGTPACDVFAFGVIMWEMLCWQLPWGIQNPWSIVGACQAGNRLPIPDRSALPGPNAGDFAGLDEYVAIMNRCWAQKPSDRPTFSQVIGQLRSLKSQT